MDGDSAQSVPGCTRAHHQVHPSVAPNKHLSGVAHIQNRAACSTVKDSILSGAAPQIATAPRIKILNLRVAALLYRSLRRMGLDTNIFSLVSRANNIQIFRCKTPGPSSSSAATEEAAETVSAERFMRMSVGNGGPARGQAWKL